MSEDETRYQVLPLDPDVVYEPGVRALQAGYEEGQAYKALALTMIGLDSELRHDLRLLATHGPKWPGGWVATTLYEFHHTQGRLEAVGLAEHRTTGQYAPWEYRLTPFGKRVADAIQGEG